MHTPYIITPTSKLAVLDLDDCLIAGTNVLFRKYASEIIGNMYDMPQEEAAIMLRELFFSHGCSFTALAERDSHSLDWVEEIYSNVGLAMAENAHIHLKPNEDLPSLVETLVEQGWTLAILTQGGREYALKMLDFMGIRPYFSLIMGRQCVGSASKKTYKPYEILLGRLTHQPTRLVMAEDTPDNLQPLIGKGWEMALIGEREATFEPHYKAPHINAFLCDLMHS